MYEHVVAWQGVEPQTGPLPNSLDLDTWPNPANSALTISYDLPVPQSGIITLELFNLLGQRVSVLEQGYRPAGGQMLPMDRQHLPAGIYILRLATAQEVQAIKVVVMK